MVLIKMEFSSITLMIALGMFIPVVGIGLGIFSGFSTGLVFNALAETLLTSEYSSISNSIDTLWNYGSFCLWFGNI